MELQLPILLVEPDLSFTNENITDTDAEIKSSEML